MSRFWRNLAALGFGLLLGGAASLSYAVTGYQAGSNCVATTTEALQYLKGLYPVPMNGSIYSLVNAGNGPTPNFILTVSHWDVPSDTPIYETLSGQYGSCVMSDSMKIFPENDVALVIAGVVLWTIGFSVGQKR